MRPLDSLFERKEIPHFEWERTPLTESLPDRCTNHVLMSFGFCRDEELITVSDLINALQDAFGENNVKIWHREQIAEMFNGKLPTVRRFAEYHPEGHFAAFVVGHVVAVHNGSVVDTERKGYSQRRIDYLAQIINKDQEIDQAFRLYGKKYPDQVFDTFTPKTRKSYKYDENDVKTELKKQGFRRLPIGFINSIVNHVRKNTNYKDFGKKKSGIWHFTKDEFEFLVPILAQSLPEYLK